MDTTLRQKLLVYLGGISIAMASGSIVNARSELAMVPESLMEEFLEEVETENWRTEDFISLIRLLAEDPRRKIRYRIAKMFNRDICCLSSDEFEQIVEKLFKTGDPLVHSTFTWGIAEGISQLTALERMQIVLGWALSDKPLVRQVVAKVLSYKIATVGTDLALEYLSDDDNPDVRLAVVEAIEKRFFENPNQYAEILLRLTHDKVDSVKTSANHAIGHLRSLTGMSEV